MSESILDKAKTAAESFKIKTNSLNEIFGDSERTEIVSQFKEKGIDKIEEVFVSIDKFKSLFYEAGYEVSGINVSLGLPPDISISFKFLGSVDEVKRKEPSYRGWPAYCPEGDHCTHSAFLCPGKALVFGSTRA